MKQHSHTFLSRRRYGLYRLKEQQKMILIQCQSLFLLDPPGRRHLGGLGSRVHAHFEQFAASRDAGSKEKFKRGGVGGTPVSSGIPAGSSSVIRFIKSLFYKENRGNRLAKISGLPQAQHCF